MKKTILILLSLALVACNEGGSGEATFADTSPFDPTKTYAEVNSTWFWLLPSVITVKYDSDIDTLYVCDENLCRNNPSNSDKLNSNQCTYSSSAHYGAWKICFTEITDSLTMSNSIWVSLEEL